ncbi:GWxTD domain-containing protein [candidate division KSB1 bacterium]|nr:GWxTD domain-containing protein [candidate division KSB1 bacterium]
MKRFSIIFKTALLSFCLLIPFFDVSTAQEPNLFSENMYEGLDFDYSYFLVPNKRGENSVLIVFTKIPYSRLIFSSFEKLFRAEYEISIEIRDGENELSQRKTWRETIQTTDYNETGRNNLYHLSTTQIPVIPGDYSLNVSIEDYNTKKRIGKSQKLKIDEHDDSKLRTTSIMFVENVEFDGDNVKSYIPSISEVLPKSGKTYYAYLEVVPSEPNQKYTIEVELKNVGSRKKVTVFKDKFERTSGIGNITIATELTDKEVLSGTYELKYKIAGGWRNNKTVTKEFYLSWFGIPTDENDLELALAQMKYAFDKVIFKNIGKMTYEEKLELFVSVWENHDPTPETPRNEFMTEYFKRVQYANAAFKSFQDGWKTDRGMIFILFGPPTDVYYFDFLSNSYPIQYWSYLFDNQVFKFYDVYNTGDFRLAVPYNYDIWTRPKK